MFYVFVMCVNNGLWFVFWERVFKNKFVINCFKLNLNGL